jgi:cobalt-zinc-cadmium efflux system membrane fusion protein
LTRIRVRFTPAEVVEVAQVIDDPASVKQGRTVLRELRSGDPVQKGDLLVVLYSVDVGSKKNDLVDALVQLKLDQDVLDRAEKSAASVPEVFLLNARRNVEGDRNAVARAENTLHTWGIPDADVQAVYDEAEQIRKRQGKRDRDKQRQWARVELRAPWSGTVIERNVSLYETVVDNTLNLFQIAQVDRLLVVAYPPEDELPALNRLSTAQRRWTIHTVGAPPDGITGPVDDIGMIIDVNQHSAVVKGHIPNDGSIRSGQYVTTTVQLPPPEDVVEIPTDALADDGKQAAVFVQPGDQPGVYTLRRVEVVRRFDKTVFVHSKFADGKDEQPLTPEEKEKGLLPRQTLKPGEKVITSGVLELKKVLEDRESEGAEQ